MSKAVRITTVGVALAGSVVLLQGSLASASPSSSSGEHHHDDEGVVLEFDVQFSPFSYTDLGEPGPGPADLIVFDDVLLTDGMPVGHEMGSCVVVNADNVASCSALITLDDGGTIAYSLENAPPPEKALVITGGGGKYRSAGGDGVLVENGDQTGTLTLNLDLDD